MPCLAFGVGAGKEPRGLEEALVVHAPHVDVRESAPLDEVAPHGRRRYLAVAPEQVLIVRRDVAEGQDSQSLGVFTVGGLRARFDYVSAQRRQGVVVVAAEERS